MKTYFDKMLQHYERPSKVVLNVINYENEHRQEFINSYTWFVSHFEHAFELLWDLVQIINYVSKGSGKFPPHRTLQWVIIKNNIATFYSSFHRLSSWFGIDSMVLIRWLFESIIRIYFISYYPESKESVFWDVPWKVRNKDKVKFNLTNFIEQQLKKNWRWQYFLLSTFAHSNVFTSVKDYVKLNTEEQMEPYVFWLWWNKDLNEMWINYLNFILWTYFYFIKEILFHKSHIEEINKRYPSLYQNLIDTEKAFSILVSWIANPNPKNRFKDMYNETLEIINELKIKENNNSK